MPSKDARIRIRAGVNRLKRRKLVSMFRARLMTQVTGVSLFCLKAKSEATRTVRASKLRTCDWLVTS